MTVAGITTCSRCGKHFGFYWIVKRKRVCEKCINEAELTPRNPDPRDAQIADLKAQLKAMESDRDFWKHQAKSEDEW